MLSEAFLNEQNASHDILITTELSFPGNYVLSLSLLGCGESGTFLLNWNLECICF